VGDCTGDGVVAIDELLTMDTKQPDTNRNAAKGVLSAADDR